MASKHKSKQHPSSRPAAPARRRGIVYAATATLVALAGLLWWLRSPPRPAEQASVPAKASPSFVMGDDAKVFATYAGSASCRDCHTNAFNNWTNSHHALAERQVIPGLDRSAFDPHRVFKHGTQTSEARVAKGQFEIITAGLSQRQQTFTPVRVIGVDPLRQFLISAPGNRLQTTEVAFDPAKQEWFNVYGEEDRQPGEWGHWTGRGMTWNNMCAACHNTRLRKNYREDADRYDTKMVEMGVGCEACHGPMADHVAWQRPRPQPAKGDPTIRKFSRDQNRDTCASCHARRSELTADFRPGDGFFDHYSLSIPDESDIFYPDGQVRDEDYEFTAFLGSRMHQGGIRCFDCHDAHSGKTKFPGNLLCMTCHGGQVARSPRIDPASHGRHKMDQEGSKCTGCHMPITTYMARHPRHDHGFTIPDPLLTKQYNIPNACTRCHPDKTVDWALEWTEKWYGKRMDRPTRQRSQWLAAAHAGEPNAHVNLLRLLVEEKNPFWRAVATGFLRRWSLEPGVTRLLLKQTVDTNALVRGTAALSLEPVVQSGDQIAQNAVRALLDDPVRKVRVDAAWVLRSTVNPNSIAGQDLTLYMQSNADQPSGLLQRAIYHLDRGDRATAHTYLRRAVSWDPNSPPLRHELAVVLSQEGRAAEAVQELEIACRLAPREAEYRFKLGLALNEVGKLKQATEALEEAVKLDPRFAQAWYNLGLAYSSSNQPERAVDALVRAESADTSSPRIPYARATILMRMGRMAEARAAAQRALEIQPSYGDAIRLLQSIPAGVP